MQMIARIATATSAALLATASIAMASWNASMSGKVVDVQSLQPVPAAHITIYAENGTRELGTAVSDARGQFTISGLTGGMYRLKFTRGGYQTTSLVGVTVRPNEHFIEAGPIAMYPDGVAMPKVAIHDLCGGLVEPGQTADVYVVCDQQ